MDKKTQMTTEDAIAFLKDIAMSIEKEKAIDFKAFYKKRRTYTADGSCICSGVGNGYGCIGM